MASLIEYNKRIVKDNIELAKKLSEAEAKAASDEHIEKAEAFDYLTGRSGEDEQSVS